MLRITIPLLILLSALDVSSQTTTRVPPDFAAGNYEKVISSLGQSKDSVDLYYVGLSNEKLGHKGAAVTAFRKSLNGAYESFRKAADEFFKTHRGEDGGPLFQDYLHTNTLAFRAAEGAHRVKSNSLENAERIRANTLLAAAKLAISKAPMMVKLPDDHTLKILNKPRPEYPKDSSGWPLSRFNQSRQDSVIVRLLVVFGADKTLKLLMPLDTTIDMFTLSSLNAAQKITFEPDFPGGQATDIVTVVEYTYSIG